MGDSASVLDPRLGAATYPAVSAPSSSSSPYTLNPLRHLPPVQPFSPKLPSLSSQDPGLPYYGAQQSHPSQLGISHKLPTEESLSAHGKNERQDHHKRPRSCEACRSLKVKCERGTLAGDPCKRCAKANRKCIFTEPSHKRKKKTDSKVAELEKKIDALTASLVAVRNHNGRGSESESSEDEESLQQSVRISSSAKSSRKRPRPSYLDERDFLNAKRLGISSVQAGSAFNQPPTIPSLRAALQSHEYADVVDRQILSSAKATEIFQFYREKMAPHFPVVVFPPHVTAGQVRQTKPILFLAILSVASRHKHSDLQLTLSREITQTYADRVIIKGEKSLELVQAMQVSTIWHVAEDPNDTRSFQLIHLATTMGMALRFTNANGVSVLGTGIRSRPDEAAEPGDETIQKKRALLSCYTLCGATAMGLRLQNMVPWGQYLEHAISFLENCRDAPLSDKLLCSWARMQHHTDDADGLFFVNGTIPNMSKALQNSEKHLHSYGKQVAESSSWSLQLLYNIACSYMRLLAIKLQDTEVGDGTTGPKEFYLRVKAQKTWTAPYLATLRASVKPLHQTLDLFLTLPRVELNALPGFVFTRITYLVISLLCIHKSALGSGTNTTKSFNPSELRVKEYVNRILDMIQPSSPDEHSRAAQKFQMVLKILRSSLEKENDGPRQQLQRKKTYNPVQLHVEPIDSERYTPRQGYRKLSVHGEKGTDLVPAPEKRSSSVNTTGTSISPVPPPPAPPPPLHIGNNPLDLLSQVATNEPPASTSSNNVTNAHSWYGTTHNTYQNQHHQLSYPGTDSQHHAYYPSQHQSYSGAPDGYAMSSNEAYHGPMLDPELEQAMGYAFGSEGNMLGLFVNDFFALGGGTANGGGQQSQAGEGLGYGEEWYAGGGTG